MQTKKHSMLEACMNTFSGMAIGFGVSQLAHILAPTIQKYIWASFVWDISTGSNAVMTILLTLISVARGYAWRRYFNKKVISTRRS